ncbi:hypothetical protein NA56DRAFT_752396 [Hyaloscypha hepaticicola]|uniref:Uncharacterized protein n=1 Tax=Hyaloscypha hepaticicola TaxID=2082293 RepID=A0A2J6PTK5_9HELO|nr:hypothetical protein NA56DRAFT_752396 [Hyaloscypha hepaticicola]
MSTSVSNVPALEKDSLRIVVSTMPMLRSPSHPRRPKAIAEPKVLEKEPVAYWKPQCAFRDPRSVWVHQRLTNSPPRSQLRIEQGD